MVSIVAVLIAFQIALVCLGVYMIHRRNPVGWIVAYWNAAMIVFNVLVHVGCAFGCTQ